MTKIDSIRFEHTENLTKTINGSGNGGLMADMTSFVDLRTHQPFGRDHDYSTEPVIVVDRMFLSCSFFNVINADDNVFQANYINNWLAIVDHYGFDRKYDNYFLFVFQEYLNTTLLHIYRDEGHPMDNTLSGALPRLFHGKQYRRSEFIDAWCDFWESNGWEF